MSHHRFPPGGGRSAGRCWGALLFVALLLPWCASAEPWERRAEDVLVVVASVLLLTFGNWFAHAQTESAVAEELPSSLLGEWQGEFESVDSF